MGVSRDTFYRYQRAKEVGGVDALVSKSRKKPNLKNRIDQSVEKAIVDLAIEEPAWGQTRASSELRRRGIIVSPAGVRCAWLRHNLENMKKRLKALEEKVANEGGILTESQLKALEKREQEKEATGEIETEHPGYLGSQDTMYVGTIKGIGRIYQQTFVDTYSRVAQAKLYTSKNALTAADMLNDKVIPFYQEVGVPLLRILTDRGTEYCGKVEQHDYQLYLAIQDIDHTKTKARHPQTNGICERFHKTIIDEFYSVAFRKKIYESLDQLQEDLDKYLETYNKNRTHQGKRSDGRTPWETFLSGKEIVAKKIINTGLQREVDMG
jgi:transposase InsO family protein